MKDDDQTSILDINQGELDKECVRLPSQYRQVAYQAAETAMDIDDLEAQLKMAEAEFHMRVRSTPPEQIPTKFNIPKLTEDALKELTLLTPKVQDLMQKIRALQRKVTLDRTLLSGMEMKKRMLTNLVDLHSAGWHAEVRPSSPAGREKMTKISRGGVAPPMAWKKDSKKERGTED